LAVVGKDASVKGHFAFMEKYQASRKLHAAKAETAPSETAVVSWRTDFILQSPATNSPSVRVRQSSAESA
jgi:hypothetical protein